MGKKGEPFNNPFFEVGQRLKKEAKKAKKAQQSARPSEARGSGTSSRPSQASEATSEATAEGATGATTREAMASGGSARGRDPGEPASDAELFLAAVSGARPVEDPRGLVPPPLPPDHAGGIPVYDEDAEAFAELVSIVEGRARFDISDSDEFIEGSIEGLDRRVLQKLRRGDYAFRDHLDLHGMTREEAREEVEVFLSEMHAEGRRCVLIVHGRGRNSKDNIPVLKVALKNWLERGRIARRVLAFCTARPTDGGAGAMYVLLRR